VWEVRDMTRMNASPLAIRVSALVTTLLLGALLVAGPAFAQDGAEGEGTNDLIRAALVGLGYYFSNSPWLAGNGGFFGLYRPLVAGFIVGIIFGDPVKGAQIGASINLLYIGFISAGGAIPADPSVAGWVGTALAMAGGLDAGSAITLGVAVGLLGTIIFFTRMSVDAVFAHWADARAEAGDITGVSRMNWVPSQIFLFIISFIPATVAVYAGAGAVADGITWLSSNAPWVLRGFEIAGGLLPAIGIALNMRFIFRGSAIPFYFIGYVFAMLIGGRFFPGVTAPSIGTVVVTTAIVGAAAAWIFVSLTGRSSESREA
jgi:mannose/fructose/N-acetylgalactosamine-specific phosphotransferase system component IIC